MLFPMFFFLLFKKKPDTKSSNNCQLMSFTQQTQIYSIWFLVNFRSQPLFVQQNYLLWTFSTERSLKFTNTHIIILIYVKLRRGLLYTFTIIYQRENTLLYTGIYSPAFFSFLYTSSSVLYNTISFHLYTSIFLKFFQNFYFEINNKLIN